MGCSGVRVAGIVAQACTVKEVCTMSSVGMYVLSPLKYLYPTLQCETGKDACRTSITRTPRKRLLCKVEVCT